MQHGRASWSLVASIALASNAFAACTGLAACTGPTATPSRIESEEGSLERPSTPRAIVRSIAEPTARADDARTPEVEPPVEIVFGSPWESAVAFPGPLGASHRVPWRRFAPEVETVEIPSSADGSMQRALFYDSGSPRDKPLLVVLHSWSATYLQNIHIPYARFAIDNDWVFVHPDFRGRNRRPEATNSELAVRDVLDAVEYALGRARVDESRIYLLGYSGGAMMSLVLAGRYPERWAGVATWVAVVDLVDWYETMRRRGSRYAREIAISCGGPPRPGTRAEAQCRSRSPMTYLPGAAGRVPVLIAHGLRDRLAPPDHAIRAFNALAAPPDRITDEERALLARERAWPRELDGERIDADPAFERAGTPVVLRRTSQQATLVLFDGDHDMLYEPGLRWLARQRRG